MEAHHPHADRTLAPGAVFGARHFGRRAVDIVLQHVVEEAHDVLDEGPVVVPLVPGLQVERGQAAHRRAVVAEMIDPGRQGDFRAQVRGRDLEPELAVMLRHHPVHCVGEDDIGLAGGQPRLDQLLEQRARIDRGAHRIILGAAQVELGSIAHRFHEFVGEQHAVVEVQGLAVEIARRLADFEELLDLGVADIEIAGRRAAPQRALRNRQGQRIHHPDEGDDAAGLAVEPDRLADAAHLAPIGADAAAAAGQPDILVPRADNALEAVRHRIEIAADRQPAPGAAVRQHRRRRHEPQPRDVVIEPLGVVLIVGIGIGDAREQILIGLAGEQIAVV